MVRFYLRRSAPTRPGHHRREHPHDPCRGDWHRDQGVLNGTPRISDGSPAMRRVPACSCPADVEHRGERGDGFGCRRGAFPTTPRPGVGRDGRTTTWQGPVLLAGAVNNMPAPTSASRANGDLMVTRWMTTHLTGDGEPGNRRARHHDAPPVARRSRKIYGAEATPPGMRGPGFASVPSGTHAGKIVVAVSGHALARVATEHRLPRCVADGQRPTLLPHPDLDGRDRDDVLAGARIAPGVSRQYRSAPTFSGVASFLPNGDWMVAT